MGTQLTVEAIPPGVREAAMRGEPDRYLAATLAPPAARPGLAAIAAFSAELARIPASVSEAMMGEIRLQWWRDALDDGRRGVLSGNPIADALIQAERRHNLAPELLLAMIDARELDLAGGLPQDDAGLTAYLEAIEGNPFRLALVVLGARRSEDRALATAAGFAYGVARSLGRLPMLLHNGGFPLPAERLRAAGLDPARLTETPPASGRDRAVSQVGAELSAKARTALVTIRGRWGALPRPMRTALLPLVMVEPYFHAQSGQALLGAIADVSPLRRAWRMGIAHLTGRI